MLFSSCKQIFNFVCPFFVLLTILDSFSCTQHADKKRQITPAAYHWKTSLQPTSAETILLDASGIQVIYLHMFDISWDGSQQRALPIAKLTNRNSNFLQNKKIIPTIFITDECIYQIKDTAVERLAANIAQQVRLLYTETGQDSFQQLQIDCDWTKTTKEKYFHLLQAIRRAFPGVVLSCTLRLHQVKYREDTGIPPVDRAMLMCYNMGNLRNPTVKNSIIDPKELEKYIAGLNTYPLKLDVALPLFDWLVLFRDNVFAGLIEDDQSAYLQRGFTTNSGNRYTITKDTVIHDVWLYKGDILRQEMSTLSDIRKVTSKLQPNLATDSLAVALYHIDAITLNKFTADELKNIFDRLR